MTDSGAPLALCASALLVAASHLSRSTGSAGRGDGQILVFRHHGSPMTSISLRKAWLEAGSPGMQHPEGILFDDWDEAISFARRWADVYRPLSVSKPDDVEYGYYPPKTTGRLESKDLEPGPILEYDEVSRTGSFRQFRLSWTLNGSIRLFSDFSYYSWAPYPEFYTSIHVIPLHARNLAWFTDGFWRNQ